MGEGIMINTLEDFTKEYKKIVKMGWIPSHREGPTGVGKTLEDLLGIKENNIDGPDFGDWELKTHRIENSTSSPLTMFTCSPEPKGAISYLLSKFGYQDPQSGSMLHASLYANKITPIEEGEHKLGIAFINEAIYIKSEDGIEKNIYWPFGTLKSHFEKKYPKNKFIYVQVESRGPKEAEEFCFKSAYAVEGFDFRKFLELLKEGKIFIDLRIGRYTKGKNAGRVHDHGTGFRISKSNQPLLFSINRCIAY